nr:aprataxin and PNK-like factor [Megalopta genalis]
MRKFQVLTVNNDLVQKTNLQIGNNIIPQNVGTERKNGQITKYAATINLLPNNELTLTPVVSCFMRSSETSRWQLLKLGTTVPIKPGDICSLVSDKCCFKIVPVPSTMEIKEEHAVKRKAEGDIDCDIPDKMLCSESGEGDNLRSVNNVSNDTLTNNNNTITIKDQEICIPKKDLSNGVVATESISPIIGTIHASSSSNADEMHASNSASPDNIVTRNTESHASEQANKENVAARTTSKTPRREKCIYGEKCYRRNPHHRAKFSHPKDPDYDIPDNRKECPYGTKCYRKNPQHKEEYKHTTKKATNDKKRNHQKPSQPLLYDLSDIEDLFADDSEEESVDESEYEPTSEAEYSDYDEHFDQNESDWEDDIFDD